MASQFPSTRSLDILLVEDDGTARELMAVRLLKMGHKVRKAGGVGEALELLARSPCEVLLADIGLIDGTGSYLLECAGPVLCPYAIAISGFSTLESVADSKAAGFRRNLVKPVVFDDLAAALKEAADCLPAR